MASLIKASVLIVASTLTATAPVHASQPTLSIDRFSASGKPSPCFVSGEIPTLQYTLSYATVSNSDFSGCVIKLRLQSDGTLVWRDYIPGNFVAYETNPNDLAAYDELLIPGLEVGNYTAEIWVKGRLKHSLKFSVSGRTDYFDNSPPPNRVIRPFRTVAKRTTTPTVALSKGFIDASIKRIDAFVGLTKQQKAEVAQIYIDANPRMLATSPDEGLPAQAAIRREIRGQIRARLTPEQQKLYDDDRSPNASADPLVAKLDDLVNLTPGQKLLAEKIFANQAPTLEKSPSTAEAAAIEMNVREKISAEIRSFLTPQQQRPYDVAPQSFGGGRITRVASSQ